MRERDRERERERERGGGGGKREREKREFLFLITVSSTRYLCRLNSSRSKLSCFSKVDAKIPISSSVNLEKSILGGSRGARLERLRRLLDFPRLGRFVLELAARSNSSARILFMRVSVDIAGSSPSSFSVAGMVSIPPLPATRAPGNALPHSVLSQTDQNEARE